MSLHLSVRVKYQVSRLYFFFVVYFTGLMASFGAPPFARRDSGEELWAWESVS